MGVSLKGAEYKYVKFFLLFVNIRNFVLVRHKIQVTCNRMTKWHLILSMLSVKRLHFALLFANCGAATQIKNTMNNSINVALAAKKSVALGVIVMRMFSLRTLTLFTQIHCGLFYSL